METLAVLANTITLLVVFFYTRWSLNQLRKQIDEIEAHDNELKARIEKLEYYSKKRYYSSKGNSGKQLLKG